MLRRQLTSSLCRRAIAAADARVGALTVRARIASLSLARPARRERRRSIESLERKSTLQPTETPRLTTTRSRSLRRRHAARTAPLAF
jgi:hypothetical protein